MNNDFISTSAIYGPYLVHHGIKGQKWGIRRFQNPDGTLTDKGKKRYLKQISNAEKRLAKAVKKDPKKYNELTKNTKEVQISILNQISSFKESKDYHDALYNLEQFYENTYDGIATKKMGQLVSKYYRAQTNFSNVFHKAFKDRENEIIGARMRDLKLPDNQPFIDLYKEYFYKENPAKKNMYGL